MVGIARVSAILGALTKASWREVRSLGSIAGQNFFLFVLFVAMQPESAGFFLLLVLVVLLFPLSSDPMLKIPEERLASWPVTRREWGVVRAGTFLLSPISWLAAVLLVRVGWRAAALMAGAGGVFYLAKVIFGSLAMKWTYRMPTLLPGLFGQIVRIQLREMLHTLDPYVAGVLMAATVLYRIFGKPLDPAAPRVMALVVALALSTIGQVLFGIDGRGGVDRYRLWPLRGWQILLAKDLAYIAMLSVLVGPLDFVSGLFGGLAALAIGHYQSVSKIVPQARWRFTSGALATSGLLQTLALFFVGFQVRTEGAPLAAACLLTWMGSVVFYGRQWDRQAL